MTVQYQIAYKNGETTRGALAYKNQRTFEMYGLNLYRNNGEERSTVITDAYREGARITLYSERGAYLQTYQMIPACHLGLWDNYVSEAPERYTAIQQVLDKLEEFDTVTVSFSYEGRTRHETAAHMFMDYLNRMGISDKYLCAIGYNYYFRITRKESLFPQTT